VALRLTWREQFPCGEVKNELDPPYPPRSFDVVCYHSIRQTPACAAPPCDMCSHTASARRECSRSAGSAQRQYDWTRIWRRWRVEGRAELSRNNGHQHYGDSWLDRGVPVSGDALQQYISRRPLCGPLCPRIVPGALQGDPVSAGPQARAVCRAHKVFRQFYPRLRAPARHQAGGHDWCRVRRARVARQGHALGHVAAAHRPRLDGE